MSLITLCALVGSHWRGQQLLQATKRLSRLPCRKRELPNHTYPFFPVWWRLHTHTHTLCLSRPPSHYLFLISLYLLFLSLTLSLAIFLLLSIHSSLFFLFLSHYFTYFLCLISLSVILASRCWVERIRIVSQLSTEPHAHIPGVVVSLINRFLFRCHEKS